MIDPQHDNTVDEHVVRLVALAVVGLAAASLLPALGWVSAILAADFFVRAWLDPMSSPLRRIAHRVASYTHLQPKPVYAPPKRFAARIGSVITMTAAVAHVGFDAAAVVLTLILIVAAGLEAFANFCVGCWVYPYVRRIRELAWRLG